MSTLNPEELGGPNIMDDLNRVGPEKAIGYQAVDLIVGATGRTIDDIRASYEEQGLRTKMYGPADIDITRDVLYVYDPEALGRLIEYHEGRLRRHGVPVDPDLFVDEVAKPVFGGVLYDVVAEAFADPRYKDKDRLPPDYWVEPPARPRFRLSALLWKSH